MGWHEGLSLPLALRISLMALFLALSGMSWLLAGQAPEVLSGPGTHQQGGQPSSGISEIVLPGTSAVVTPESAFSPPVPRQSAEQTSILAAPSTLLLPAPITAPITAPIVG